MFFIIPCMDTFVKTDLRTVSFDVPPQEVSTDIRELNSAPVYFRYVFHHSVHGFAGQGGPENNLVWCTAARSESVADLHPAQTWNWYQLDTCINIAKHSKPRDFAGTNNFIWMYFILHTPKYKTAFAGLCRRGPWSLVTKRFHVKIYVN